jgi:hypothetical protein
MLTPTLICQRIRYRRKANAPVVEPEVGLPSHRKCADPVGFGWRLRGSNTRPSNHSTGEKGNELATEHDDLSIIQSATSITIPWRHKDLRQDLDQLNSDALAVYLLKHEANGCLRRLLRRPAVDVSSAQPRNRAHR